MWHADTFEVRIASALVFSGREEKAGFRSPNSSLTAFRLCGIAPVSHQAGKRRETATYYRHIHLDKRPNTGNGQSV